MKLLLNLGISMCLSVSLFAEVTFRDDGPPGFIHLTYPNRNPKLEPVDVFIPARNIVEIKIDSDSGDDGTVFEVEIKTNGTTSGAEMSRSMSYVFEFKTKAEAMKCAARLMRITANGEQSGGGQPATRPESK